MLEHNSDLSEVSFKRISNEGLRQLAASQSRTLLRTIEAKVDDSSLEAIRCLCKACPSIRSLILWSDDRALDGNLISHCVAQNCPLIESMSTEHWYLTDDGMDALALIHTLKELRVSGSECTSSAIQSVFRSNPHLTLIRLYGKYIDDTLVSSIGNYCRNLKRLILSKCEKNPSLNSNSFIDLFRGCPLLESFHLYQQGGISDVALRAMFEYCHYLTKFALFGGAISEASLIGHEPILYSHYSNLVSLIANDGITDSALQSIFTYCTNLREVKLTSCTNLTDEMAAILAHNCSSLDTLLLDDCGSVTVAGMLEVATYCSSLKVLSLALMPVNDEFLIQLSLHCHHFSHLTLFNCKGEPITERGVQALVERCTGLSYISIRVPRTESLVHSWYPTQLKRLYPHIDFDIII